MLGASQMNECGVGVASQMNECGVGCPTSSRAGAGQLD